MAGSAEAIELAKTLLRWTRARSTRAERRQQARLAAVVGDEQLRELTFALTDEVLRFADDRRAAARLEAIVDEIGVPRALPVTDRIMLHAGKLANRVAPDVVMPLVRRRILGEAAGVILDAADPAFTHHLSARRGDGFGVNVNVLGEAILSDMEADERMRMILERISRPDVDYVSLKVSAIVANLDVLAFDHSVARIAERLRTLFRAAAASSPRTFLNLDMEEYRDLHLTLDALRAVLDEREFEAVDAGVVLQAYLPDAHQACDDLCAWATARHHRRGGHLKIRVVKGANLAMEHVDAELHGWVAAPYGTKAEVDASYKRLVDRALDPRWVPAVRVGLASHNLFDIAWAMLRPDRHRVEFEMLEGMAPAQARVVRDIVGRVLLYAPVVRREDLPASLAYLSRRLDENTSPDNFLRAAFTLEPDSLEWYHQSRRFDDSLDAAHTVDTRPRRRQDRTSHVEHVDAGEPFANAADTDWTCAANRAWIAKRLATVAPTGPRIVESVDEVDGLVERAVAAAARWRTSAMAERRELLHEVATEMERSRGATIAVMARTCAKTVAEGDPEVSEAVDAARYAAWSTNEIEARRRAGRHFEPFGVVVVAAPWNFPFAIPAGGVLAALAAGNAVILKPAPEARAVAHELAAQLWRAGVPDDLVQLAACPDDEVGQRLVSHPDVAAVVLTGSYETARLFRSWNPTMRLFGETSGKNAIVVTAAADEDAAIRDIVRSAFGHAGQKCSAASLVIVEASVHDHSRFLARLAAAAASVRVGPADELETMMGPLIGPPTEKLARAFSTLDRGERWLLEPRRIDEVMHLWSPGIRIGVADRSWFHLTECFGPVLGVMRADSLDHAIELQNRVEYGLTGGIQSLDVHEVRHWLARVEVGNAYVNRHTTGAIVRRQPFGGWKRSSTGGGAKPGGPHYVEGFGTWQLDPASRPDTDADFARVWRDEYSARHDRSALASEVNVLRHRPFGEVGLYVAPDAAPGAVRLVEVAARIAGVRVRRLDDPATPGLPRVRVLGALTEMQHQRCNDAEVELDLTPPIADASLELRHWVREQAVSITAHRHGRLVVRDWFGDGE